tara:strand:- start:2180 stop:2389 length:210 start_codon:yes stop_codon:yes gene_type:complete
MYIKRSPTTNRARLIIKGEKYFGFKIAKMPNRFASIIHSQPITDWFNHKGYTFIKETNFTDLFGNITIE